MEGFANAKFRTFDGVIHIPRKNDIRKEWLLENYVERNLSARECAELYGCGQKAILNNLQRHGLKIRASSVRVIDIPYELLEEYYIKKRMSIRECAAMLGYDKSVIWDRLHYFGIPVRTRSENHVGKPIPEAVRKKISASVQGERNGNWLGGASYAPYCPKFNERIKEEIREKYGRRCFICNGPETGHRLSIHHVDYNKNTLCNGKTWGLIPLCTSCHVKTNTQRWYWFSVLGNYWATNPSINFDYDVPNP